MDEEELNEFYGRHGIVPECQSGWHKIIVELDSRIAAIAPNYKAEQIKEKFGALRFYYDSMSIDPSDWDTVNDLVRSAEDESLSTCEVCGATGSTVGPRTRSRWIKTLCETHAN
ncbi:hypothetical protein [Brevibacterium atlanticum]|uniref:hypothetical protein n=1 Tax=Brevibacterium atlanticum TaxID=2697563 RepID=UPI00141EB7EA|nr:hypothetical protein [Brevibacterium atlanticum]